MFLNTLINYGLIIIVSLIQGLTEFLPVSSTGHLILLHSLFPGTSRSGITIIAGMAAKLNREAAVRFSFLLSVPIVLGANIKEIPNLWFAISNGNDLLNFCLGFLFTFVFSYFTLKYFLIFIKNNSLNIFAYYRFALAAIILLLWFF